jgi:hypothetical protein
MAPASHRAGQTEAALMDGFSIGGSLGLGLPGSVSRGDLLKPYLRSDESIRGEITSEGLGRFLGLPPEAVEVSVAEGVVTVDGELETSTAADLAIRFTEAVEGVGGVHDRLAHRHDPPSRARRSGRAPEGCPPPNGAADPSHAEGDACPQTVFIAVAGGLLRLVLGCRLLRARPRRGGIHMVSRSAD